MTALQPHRAENGELLFPMLESGYQEQLQQQRATTGRALLTDLYAAIDPSVREASRAAHTLATQRADLLQQARERLAAHQATRPQNASSEAAALFSRRTNQLRGELEFYEQDANEARQQLARAQQAERIAVEAERQRRIVAHRADLDQRHVAIQRRVVEIEKQKETEIAEYQQACKPIGERLRALENLYDFLG